MSVALHLPHTIYSLEYPGKPRLGLSIVLKLPIVVRLKDSFRANADWLQVHSFLVYWLVAWDWNGNNNNSTEMGKRR